MLTASMMMMIVDYREEMAQNDFTAFGSIDMKKRTLRESYRYGEYYFDERKFVSLDENRVAQRIYR